MASSEINTTIKIAKWALDNMTVKYNDGRYLVWIKLAKVYGSGETSGDAVLDAIQVMFDYHADFISEPEFHFAGPALEMRKMFIKLFGGGDE